MLSLANQLLAVASYLRIHMRVVSIFSFLFPFLPRVRYSPKCQTIPLRTFSSHTTLGLHTSVLTIHLALIREDDLPASTRRIDGQGLLEALFNIRAPHPLCIIVYGLVCRVAHPLHVLGRALAAAPAAGINRGGWALQAEAWSRLGRDLEFPKRQTQRSGHFPQQNSGHLLPKKQHSTQC